jgi:molybdate transport system substrate-binding protein
MRWKASSVLATKVADDTAEPRAQSGLVELGFSWQGAGDIGCHQDGPGEIVSMRMRGTCKAIFMGLALIISASMAQAADLRVLSLGSVQIAVKAFAQDFTKATGNKVALTTVAPGEIGQKLASASYDMIICSVPAMEAFDRAGTLRPGSRSPLSRVGIGVMVREGAPLPDVSTPEAFKKTLLAARSIVHGDPAMPNQSGALTVKILADAGVLDAVAAKARAANLAEGFAMVAKGEVELALFNLVELPPGVRLVGPVPAPLQEYTSYETAVLAQGAAPEEAQAFIKSMTGASARKTWEASSLEAHP